MLMSRFSETSLNEFLKLSGRRQCLMHPGTIWTLLCCISSVCLVTFSRFAFQIKVTRGPQRCGDHNTHVVKEHRRREIGRQWLFAVCVVDCAAAAAEELLSHSCHLLSLRCERMCCTYRPREWPASACLHFVVLFFSQIQWFRFLFWGFLMICFPQVFSVKILSLVDADINYY